MGRRRSGPVLSGARAARRLPVPPGQRRRPRRPRRPRGRSRRRCGAHGASAAVRNPRPPSRPAIAPRAANPWREEASIPPTSAGGRAAPAERSCLVALKFPPSAALKRNPSEGKRITPPASDRERPATSVSCGAAAWATVRPGRSGGILGERPAGDDRRDRDRRGVARRLEPPAVDERERARRRRAPRRSTADESGRSSSRCRSGCASAWTTTRPPGRDGRRARQPGRQRPEAEARGELGLAGAGGVGRQVDGGEVGARRRPPSTPTRIEVGFSQLEEIARRRCRPGRGASAIAADGRAERERGQQRRRARTRCRSAPMLARLGGGRRAARRRRRAGRSRGRR